MYKTRIFTAIKNFYIYTYLKIDVSCCGNIIIFFHNKRRSTIMGRVSNANGTDLAQLITMFAILNPQIR